MEHVTEKKQNSEHDNTEGLAALAEPVAHGGKYLEREKIIVSAERHDYFAAKSPPKAEEE